MARGAYLALARVEDTPETVAHAHALAAALDRAGVWRPAGAFGPWRVWTAGVSAPPVEALGAGGLVVGERFDHPNDGAAARRLRQGPGGPLAAEAVARALCRGCWGRYVALLADAAGPSVLRDPSGGLEALAWTPAPGLRVAASELARVPLDVRPLRTGLDWDRIAGFLARPAVGMAESLFEGIASVAPGELLDLAETGVRRLVWDPADFAGRAVDGREAAPELVRRVDRCVAALAGRHDRLVVELSGGLDSSIVAGALAEVGRSGRVSHWLNWTGAREGDERLYAEAVAARLGVPLTVRPKAVRPLTPEDLAETADALWPAMSGPDSARDREETALVTAAGASAIVSGQGGDAVFYQMRSPLVAADLGSGLRLGGLCSEQLADMARRNQMSVWAVLAAVRTERRGRRAPEVGSGASLVPAAVRAATADRAHPWVSAARAAGVAPGKQVQVQALANCLVYQGDSRRRRAAEVIFPLLAQPVVELALAIPAAVLAGAAHDRMYARAAFAARIPELVRRRRVKGALGAYFGKLVAASAATLRPYLLEGVLADAGLLDRAAVALALEPDAMMRDGRPTEVMWAAAVEAWVRHWQTRFPDALAAPRPRV